MDQRVILVPAFYASGLDATKTYTLLERVSWSHASLYNIRCCTQWLHSTAQLWVLCVESGTNTLWQVLCRIMASSAMTSPGSLKAHLNGAALLLFAGQGAAVARQECHVQ